MNFPVLAEITKSNAKFPTAVLLKVDGNSGNIPNSFQCSLWGDEEQTELLNQPNVAMTQLQWAAWTNQDDEDYILTCIAENLGLEIKLPSVGAAQKKSKRSAAKRGKKSR